MNIYFLSEIKSPTHSHVCVLERWSNWLSFPPPATGRMGKQLARLSVKLQSFFKRTVWRTTEGFPGVLSSYQSCQTSRAMTGNALDRSTGEMVIKLLPVWFFTVTSSVQIKPTGHNMWTLGAGRRVLEPWKMPVLLDPVSSLYVKLS